MSSVLGPVLAKAAWYGAGIGGVFLPAKSFKGRMGNAVIGAVVAVALRALSYYAGYWGAVLGTGVVGFFLGVVAWDQVVNRVDPRIRFPFS